MKQVSLRVVTGLVLIAIIVTATIAYFAWAATPTTDIWVSPGIYPGAPSYTIWREGSNYFAKDQNGHIDYSGTNASDVINDAINGFNYGTIMLRDGTYVLTASIIFDSKEAITFKGENQWGDYGGVRLTSSSEIPLIWVHDSAFLKFENLILLGVNFSETQSVFKIGNFTGVNWVDDSHNIELNNVKVQWGKYGIHILDTQKFRLNKVWAIRQKRACIRIESDCPSGNYLYGILTDVEATDSYGYGIHIINNRDMIRLDKCHIIKSDDSGIYVNNATGGGIVRITNTDIETTYNNHGIVLNGSANAEISNCYVGDANDAAIWLYYASNNRVVNNYIIQCDVGVKLDVDSNNNTFTMNNFVDCATTTFEISYSLENIIQYNKGFVTEAHGNASASNDDWVSFDTAFAATPQRVLVTVMESDARYIAQVKDKNTTHFQLYLFDETAGAAETVDKAIAWAGWYYP